MIKAGAFKFTDFIGQFKTGLNVNVIWNHQLEFC